jgi:hypothetical protein
MCHRRGLTKWSEGLDILKVIGSEIELLKVWGECV